MAEIRGREWPKMEGCSAHTNGPGRIDDREYPQTANFMTNPASESFQFSIGSENHTQSIKKTRHPHFARSTSTGGTVLHKSPSHVDPIETATRAETDGRADYDKRVDIARADCERRVEMARGDEYDRMECVLPSQQKTLETHDEAV